AVARHLEPHPHRAWRPGNSPCAVCGLYVDDNQLDLSYMNFERFKWGGVRRLDLGYLWFDLAKFSTNRQLIRDESAAETLSAVLRVFGEAEPDATLAEVAWRLKGIVP